MKKSEKIKQIVKNFPKRFYQGNKKFIWKMVIIIVAGNIALLFKHYQEQKTCQEEFPLGMEVTDFDEYMKEQKDVPSDIEGLSVCDEFTMGLQRQDGSDSDSDSDSDYDYDGLTENDTNDFEIFITDGPFIIPGENKFNKCDYELDGENAVLDYEIEQGNEYLIFLTEKQGFKISSVINGIFHKEDAVVSTGMNNKDTGKALIYGSPWGVFFGGKIKIIY